MPLPPKLLRRGITDILRISDARMSGTAYGSVVLHVRPRPPPAVRWRWCAMATSSRSTCRHGAWICDVSDAELAQRRAAWQTGAEPTRGWYKLYVDHVQQAHLGADLDVLVGKSGAEVTRDSH